MIFALSSNPLCAQLRIWGIGFGLFLSPLASYAQIWSCYDFRSSDRLPDLVLSSRSVALVSAYEANRWQQRATHAFAEAIQAAFAPTGLDMAWYVETPLVFASKATQKEFLSRIRKRDIQYWVALQRHTQGEDVRISLRIGRLSTNERLADPEQTTFYLEAESLEELLARFEQMVVSQGIVSANFLVNEHPEWMPSFRTAALVGKIGDPIPQDAYQNGLVLQWPNTHPCAESLSQRQTEINTLFERNQIKHTYNPTDIPDRTLYKQGYNYALYILYAPPEVLKTLLPDLETPSAAPAYVIYLRHLLSQRRAMPTPLRAYTSLTEALQTGLNLPR